MTLFEKWYNTESEDQLCFDIHNTTQGLFASTEELLDRDFHFIEITKHYKPSPDLSNRLIEYNNHIKRPRGPHVRTKIDARVISKRVRRNIIILDAEKRTNSNNFVS